MSQLLSPAVVNAFLRLKSPEFEPLRTYLVDLRENTLEVLAVAGDIDLIRKQQGKAKQLEELIQLIEASDQLAAKLRK